MRKRILTIISAFLLTLNSLVLLPAMIVGATKPDNEPSEKIHKVMICEFDNNVKKLINQSKLMRIAS